MEIDLNALMPAALSAAMRGGTEGWGVVGSAGEHIRYMQTTQPNTRKKCPCCGKRKTHVGMANGVALMSGCELRVRRWVRDGSGAKGGEKC